MRECGPASPLTLPYAGDLRQRALAALEPQPGPHRLGVAGSAPGPVQPIPGETLLSSVILSILLTLAVGGVRMLQLAAWPSARPWWSGDGAADRRDGRRIYGKCRRKITTLEN